MHVQCFSISMIYYYYTHTVTPSFHNNWIMHVLARLDGHACMHANWFARWELIPELYGQDRDRGHGPESIYNSTTN